MPVGGTFTVYPVFPELTVKVPAAPAVPHVLVPFTATTVPATRLGRGGTTVTREAERRPVAGRNPMARTLSPTQTTAKDGELTPFSLKVVARLTATVSVA